MSPNSFNSEKILATNERIWELRTLQNLPLRDIAKQMEISPSTVHKRLKKISVEYAKANLTKLDYYKTLQVKDLERVAHEAWDSWIESKKPKTIKRTTQFVDPETAQVKEMESFEYRPGEGNYKFLVEYRAALADIRDILGIKLISWDEEFNSKGKDEQEAAIIGFVDELIAGRDTPATNTIN